VTYRIGLIGLGTMGAPMAKNIAGAGLPLVVFNRSPEPLRAFEGTNVDVASSVQDVFDKADQIVLIMNTEAAFDEVLARKGDSFGVEFSSKLIVNAATLTPGYSKALAQDVIAAGGIYIDAPVSGSKEPAVSGNLVVMSAGDPADVEAAAPIFDAIGRAAVNCGDIPNAMAMKSATSVLLASVMGGLAEAASFARGNGLDLDLFARIILGGPMGNEFLKMKLPRLMAEDFSPQASVKNVAEALDIMIATANETYVDIPQAEAMRASCEKALQAGLGEEDILALTKVLQSTSGAGGA
jgi:3-hydroxyisobutyrate dehydrogenase